MIEKTIIKFLTENYDVPVFAEVPTTPPKRFIVIEKTSGGRTNHVNRSTVAVQTYGENLLDAAEMSDDLKTWMFLLVSDPTVSAVVLNSEYNYTDTTTKRYRYQSIYDIVHF